MDRATLDECIEYVLELVRHCGTIVNEAISTSKEVTTKAHRLDWVTEYDKRVEDILITGIADKYPEHIFIGEESIYNNHLPDLTNEPTWIIDPIDGTQNFVKGIKLIAISVGLVVNKEVVAAICYNPCMDELYTARKGQGAYLNGTKLYSSGVDKFRDCIIGLPTFGPDRNKLLAKNSALTAKCAGVRVLGSVAITLCYVASGLMDAYSCRCAPWDSAAGFLLITEAGGCVKSITGEPVNLMKPNFVAAATEMVCDEMIDLIHEIEDKLRQEENVKVV